MYCILQSNWPYQCFCSYADGQQVGVGWACSYFVCVNIWNLVEFPAVVLQRFVYFGVSELCH